MRSADPAITYLHGLDLVAQSDGAATEYFLYDGLGSVRQVADEAGSPLLTQTFDPYGNIYARAGIAEAAWGFTGEYGDTNGLLYLRARYYAPSQGRFFQLDPSRLERNLYLYALSNPVNLVDPSGLIPNPAVATDAEEAYKIIRDVRSNYNVSIEVDFGWIMGGRAFIPYNPTFSLGGCDNWIEGKWELAHIESVQAALEAITDAVRDAGSGDSGARLSLTRARERVRDTFGNIRVSPSTVFERSHAIFPQTVTIGRQELENGLSNPDWLVYTVVHEIGHIWDKRSLRWERNALIWGLSYDMSISVGRQDRNCYSYTDVTCFSTREAPPGRVENLEEYPTRTNYAARGGSLYGPALEDFAESFAEYVTSYYENLGLPTYRGLHDIRREYIATQLRRIAGGG